MGAWIFILIMNLLIPFSLIGIGIKFSKNPPEKVNKYYGYRTSRSMENKETWDFANKYFGKVSYRSGVVMFFATVLLMVYLIGNLEMIWGYGLAITVLQVLVLLLLVILVESAIKKEFDSDGNRR